MKQGPGQGCLSASFNVGSRGGKWFRGEVEKEEGAGTVRWQIGKEGTGALPYLTWAPVSEVGRLTYFLMLSEHQKALSMSLCLSPDLFFFSLCVCVVK